jgi:hypothetical protein
MNRTHREYPYSDIKLNEMLSCRFPLTRRAQ